MLTESFLLQNEISLGRFNKKALVKLIEGHFKSGKGIIWRIITKWSSD